MGSPKRTLPGGAELVERDGRRAAVRPGAAVVERVRPAALSPPPPQPPWNWELTLKVAAGVVTVIGAVLGLFGLSRK